MRKNLLSLPSGAADTMRNLARGQLALPTADTMRQWIHEHREALWITMLLLISALTHGINMFGFPYYESDEGTYMSQAWAVLYMGELAPYTYWYDHAPAGWLQIALWTVITGGFYTFGPPVNSGRVLMLLMHIGSAFMVYRIVRTISNSIAASTIATLTFVLSAFGTYFARRVLLDNIATFWMLLSILLLIDGRLSLKRIWLSALALGISILSKELTIFLVPVLAYLAFFRAHPSVRWLGAIGWVTIVGSLFSTYILMAILKGELFPTGTWLGGTHEHVSLLGSLEYQTGRGKDGGLLDPNSNFWIMADSWIEGEPLLVVWGSICAILSAIVIRWYRLIGIMGLVTLSLWAFLGRGGIVLGFYLVPLIPLLAINLGLVVGGIAQTVQRYFDRYPGIFRSIGAHIPPVAACIAIAGVIGGYTYRDLGFKDNPLTLWNNSQADVNSHVVGWVIENLPPDSRIIIDQSMWTDLHHIPGRSTSFEHAHYYWKVFEDPEIRDDVFQGDWRTVDYIITTYQLLGDTNRIEKERAQLVLKALEHSTLLARFDTGGWPVEVRKVHPDRANGQSVGDNDSSLKGVRFGK